MIEADLQRHYGTDLCDLWRGKVSLRRIAVLVRQLPPDSRTAHNLRGVYGEAAQWTTTEALLAVAIDELAALRWEWGWVQTDPAKRNEYRQPPDPIRGPTDKPKAEDIPVVHPRDLGKFISGQL